MQMGDYVPHKSNMNQWNLILHFSTFVCPLNLGKRKGIATKRHMNVRTWWSITFVEIAKLNFLCWKEVEYTWWTLRPAWVSKSEEIHEKNRGQSTSSFPNTILVLFFHVLTNIINPGKYFASLWVFPNARAILFCFFSIWRTWVAERRWPSCLLKQHSQGNQSVTPGLPSIHFLSWARTT